MGMSQCGNSSTVSQHPQKGINGAQCAVSCMEREWERGLRILRLARNIVRLRLPPRPSAGWKAALSLPILAVGAFGPCAGAGEPPLVALSTIDSGIGQDMRYASDNNFTGRRVPGYEAAECWLRPAAAHALAKVHADLVAEHPDLSLKVFDCYRPRRAVQAFVAWAGSTDDGKTRYYYPNVSRKALLARGYIGRSSNHSKGIAVDLTLVRRPVSQGNSVGTRPVADNAEAPRGVACTQTSDRAFDANSLDMGTMFDCFDRKSHTQAAGLTGEQRSARQMLTRLMERRGFQNYAKEWWHFTYGGGGDNDGGSFDMPVQAAPSQAPQATGK